MLLQPVRTKLSDILFGESRLVRVPDFGRVGAAAGRDDAVEAEVERHLEESVKIRRRLAQKRGTDRNLCCWDL